MDRAAGGGTRPPAARAPDAVGSGGVGSERVQVRVVRCVLLDLIELVEAAGMLSGPAEAKPCVLQLLDRDQDVVESPLPFVGGIGRGLLLVELHEHAVVSEL